MSDQATHSVHCAANGCTGAGVMSRSTTGGAEWWCANHLMAEPGRIHEVTAEMRRLGWLVQLCKGLRHFLNTGIWTPEAQQGYDQIALHQRSDLYQQASVAATANAPGRPNETHRQWLARLEGVLREACAAPPLAEPHQQPLDV
jgi:hypothetical protein